MSNGCLANWLARYDPIHRGWTREGIANGLCSTNGFFFPRIRGGYNLYRRMASDSDSMLAAVGATGADAQAIRTFAWVEHEEQTDYVYRLVPVGGGGVENWADVTEVAVLVSLAGSWVGTLPNPPADLHLVHCKLGRLMVRWSHYPRAGAPEPAGFRLYSSFGDEIDYGAAEAEVPYAPGRVHYEYLTTPRPDGERVGWAVRAYGASGHEEDNVNSVFALTRAKGPPGDPVVTVSLVEHRQGEL